MRVDVEIGADRLKREYIVVLFAQEVLTRTTRVFIFTVDVGDGVQKNCAKKPFFRHWKFSAIRIIVCSVNRGVSSVLSHNLFFPLSLYDARPRAYERANMSFCRLNNRKRRKMTETEGVEPKSSQGTAVLGGLTIESVVALGLTRTPQGLTSRGPSGA
jgi:hypothetical protein